MLLFQQYKKKFSVNHNGEILLSRGIFEAYELLKDGTTVIIDGEEKERVFKNINNGEVYMPVYAGKADDTKEALLYKVTGF